MSNQTQTRQYLKPDLFPATVSARFTTRLGGVGQTPYDSFNTAFHVEDEFNSVESNRQLLKRDLDIQQIAWLDQVHGVEVVKADSSRALKADALWTDEPGLACAIQVADCMPVLVSNQQGTKVGAAHAGWRSLCDGVIPELMSAMQLPPSEAIVWTGPCIQQGAFEVGPEVKSAFKNSPAFMSLDVDMAFNPGAGDRFFANLPMLAKIQLEAMRCQYLYQEDTCTYQASDRFFSFRRDGKTGRMSALIWIKSAE